MTDVIKLMNLQMFSDEGNGVEDTVAEGQGTDSTEAKEGTANPTEPFAVFPDQESFNKRLTREAKKHLNDTLSGLGVESLDELKAFIEDKKAKEEAEKSELQKAQELIQKLTQERDGYVKAELERKRIETATAKAMELGVKPERVKHLLRLVDMEAITTDGEVDATALTSAIGELLEEFPEFKQTKVEHKGGTDFNETGTTGAKPALTMEMIKQMSSAEIAERIEEVRAVLGAK